MLSEFNGGNAATLKDTTLEKLLALKTDTTSVSAEIKDMVTKVGGNLVGVVLNNINISQDSYYYYYSGYYYDYYYKSRETEEESTEDNKNGGNDKLIAQADIGGDDVKPKY